VALEPVVLLDLVDPDGDEVPADLSGVDSADFDLILLHLDSP
jgi:hypothetical protein